MREEPEERAWQAQQDWIREMLGPTWLDWAASILLFAVLSPVYVVLAPMRWWRDRKDRG